MSRASPIQQNFNAGEFSPRMAGRTDIGKYASACKLVAGYIPTIQGPAVRRGGFRWVAEVKNSAARTWLVRFEFNTAQAYQLEFGDRYIRFFSNHGRVVVSGVAAYNGATAYGIGDLVVQGGINYYAIAATTGNAPPNATYWYPLTGDIYEIPTVYTTADLTDSEGNFNLRFEQSADVIYFAHTAHPPQKLQRLGPTKFTMSQVVFSGGPFQDVNLTATTIYATAGTGATQITASAPIFTANLVGSLIQLRQKATSTTLPWIAGIGVAAGELRASDNKNYKTLAGGTTGGDRPVHTFGSKQDGNPGVLWEYQDAGFGVVRVDSFVSSTVLNVTVVSPFPEDLTPTLPSDVVGAGNATTRWNFGAWSDAAGWPSQVAFYRERLCFGRDQTVWLSVVGDYETFTARDPSDIVTSDMAITLPLKGPKVNNIQWMQAISSAQDALVCGTAGSEYAVKSMTDQTPFGTDNNTAAPISTLGSSNAFPARIGNILLFIQRAGFKLRDVLYEFTSDSYKSEDQSILAEHLPKGGVTQLCFQQEPYSIVWAIRPDGLLMAMTYSREMYPEAPHGGWHRHPVGGNGVVESLSEIPAPDKSRNELWAITRRTINGATKRYVEWMEWERRPNDDPEDSFYVDSGLTLDNVQAATLTPGVGATVSHTTGVPFVAGSAIFSGADVAKQIHYRYFTTDEDGVRTYFTAKATITAFNTSTNVTCTIDAAFPSLALIPANGWRLTVTTITGLSHLEGQSVDVLVNGAVHPSQTVSGGAISLQYPASKAQVGLPFITKLQAMRLNAGARDGTSQGKKSIIKSAVIRVDESLGLQYGASFDTMYEIDFRKALDSMDNPPPMFTGDLPVDWPGDYDTNPWLCIRQPYPLPSTIVAMMPQVVVSDKG